MNQEPKIGTQAEFNKFANSNAQSINADPGEFDRMLDRKTADADAERTDALKDLAQYEANAQAPVGIMEQGVAPESPEQIVQAESAASTEPKPLIHQ